MLRALTAWRFRVKNRAVLAGVKMAPESLRLMIVQPAKCAAFGARPLLAIRVCKVNMHFARLQLQLNRLNSPRALDAQYRRVQLVILQGKYSSRKALYTAGYPLQSRKRQ
jgi:Holliday junction resolvase